MIAVIAGSVHAFQRWRVAMSSLIDVCHVPPVALRVVPDTMFSSGGGDPLPGRHIVHREIAADDPVTVQVQKAARVFGTRPMFTAH